MEDSKTGGKRGRSGVRGMEKGKAHIVYASDNSFVEIMGISMVSLYDNSQDMDEIAVYILDGGIAEEEKQKVELICREYHRPTPVWIPAKDISQELSMKVTVDRGSLSQYARLFVASVLPESLDRVIYLDCDTIFNQSIQELWNLDMHGYTIAALKDAFSKHYRGNIGLQANDIMFNSGVMLIDLNLWKKNSIEKRLLKFIMEKNGKIQQGDQGALNAVLSSDTYCFEPKFNSVTIFFDFTYEEMLIYRKPPEFYTKEEVKIAVEDPVIIHYTTSFLSKRPWVEGCRHRYVDKWMKYKAMSPWNNQKISRFQKGRGLAGVCISIVNAMPRVVAIWFSGLLQAYGRPLFLKMKYR